MKKAIVPVLAAVCVLLALPRCGKSGGGGGCNEAAISVTTVPANNSVEVPSPGPDFPLQVNITANKPAAGVTIEVKAHEEGSTNNFYSSGAISSTSSANNFTITGTPSGKACVVDITVTSKSCATNKWTGSYGYSMK